MTGRVKFVRRIIELINRKANRSRKWKRIGAWSIISSSKLGDGSRDYIRNRSYLLITEQCDINAVKMTSAGGFILIFVTCSFSTLQIKPVLGPCKHSKIFHHVKKIYLINSFSPIMSPSNLWNTLKGNAQTHFRRYQH